MQDSRIARLLERAPSHRFAQGDQGELRRWSNEVRAIVQRLALPEPSDLTATPIDGGFMLRRNDDSTLRVTLTGPLGSAMGQVGVKDGSVEWPAVVAIGGVPSEIGAGTVVCGLSIEDETADDGALLLAGRSRLALLVDDALAVSHWLRTLPGIGEVTFYGIGAGAAVALHAALIAGGSAPVALRDQVESYATGHIGTRAGSSPNRPDAGSGELSGGLTALALPGILRSADLPDLVAALAPRPLWLESGNATVASAYKAFSAEDRLEVGTSLAGFLGAAKRTAPAIPPLRVHFGIPARLEVADRLDLVLASGMLTQGSLVGEFEELARRYIGAEPVAVSTGTAALDIAYQLLNVAGKTVLAPVNTFFATAASVERSGGKVDFVDVELDGFGMDPQSLREALERHDDVAAVVVVHIAGVVSPSFKEVLAECAARGIPVVEDTAHALGSTIDGQLAGSIGAMGTYSLHPAKVATSGEGGFFTAKDPAHLDAARKLRDHGKISIDKNIHDRLGNNWRLSEVHAAVGLAHFAQLDEMLAMRRELAAWYDEHVDSVPRVTRYKVPAGSESNYYKYVAFLDPEVDRAELKARLRQRHGVSLAGEVYDVLLSDQPYYAARFAGRTFAQASWFTRHHICLPAFPSMTAAEQQHVLHALRTELS